MTQRCYITMHELYTQARDHKIPHNDDLFRRRTISHRSWRSIRRHQSSSAFPGSTSPVPFTLENLLLILDQRATCAAGCPHTIRCNITLDSIGLSCSCVLNCCQQPYGDTLAKWTFSSFHADHRAYTVQGENELTLTSTEQSHTST